jgi:hypothetical protein
MAQLFAYANTMSCACQKRGPKGETAELEPIEPMVLVFGKLRNDIGILQTKFRYREGHETRRIGP